jgi:hypothetical protein
MGGRPATQPAAPAGASGGSFLDDWLNKRRTQPAGRPGAPAVARPTTAPPVTNQQVPFNPPALQQPPASQPPQQPQQPMASIRPAQSGLAQAPSASTGLETPSGSAAQTPGSFGPPPAFGIPSQQPAEAPRAKADVAASPAGTKNISSDEIEQTEVDKIAAELKQQLGAKDSAQPDKPAAPKAEDHIPLESGKDDTIFIDRDGSFRPNS